MFVRIGGALIVTISLQAWSLTSAENLRKVAAYTRGALLASRPNASAYRRLRWQ